MQAVLFLLHGKVGTLKNLCALPPIPASFALLTLTLREAVKVLKLTARLELPALLVEERRLILVLLCWFSRLESVAVAVLVQKELIIAPSEVVGWKRGVLQNHEPPAPCFCLRREFKVVALPRSVCANPQSLVSEVPCNSARLTLFVAMRLRSNPFSVFLESTFDFVANLIWQRFSF